MNRFILICFVVCLNFSFAKSQNNNPDGYNRFNYPDGSISAEGNIVDGKPDGYWKTYYPDGKLKSEGNRIDFQLSGVWVFYAQNGDTSQTIDYLRGQKNGFKQIYFDKKDSAGRLIVKSKELYLNDKRSGVSFYFNENGALETEITFKDDIRHGGGYSYKPDGTVSAILTYKYNELVDKQIINRIDENQKKQGLWLTFYPGHKVNTEAYYKDDKLNGYKRSFDKNGKEISVERYIDGQLQVENKNSLAKTSESVKIVNEFYSDGTIKSSGGYKNNKPVGIFRTYNEKGKINGSEIYNDNGVKTGSGIVDGKGREQGPWKLYYEDGRNQSSGNYKNGLREGEWLFYFPEGNIEQKGNYSAGKPSGQWIWYYPTGKIRRCENFRKAVEDGLYYELSYAGDTLVSGQYYEGEKDGFWKTVCGDVRIEENFKYGMLHGVYTAYYLPENKIKIDAEYLQGDLNGNYKEYYPDGQLKLSGKYLVGKKNGEFLSYSPEGIIETTTVWLQGEIVKIDGSVLKTEQ